MIHRIRIPAVLATFLFGLVLPVRMAPSSANSRLAEIICLPSLQTRDWQDLFSLAESGDPEAQYWLGTIYDRGRLLPLDKEKADFWLQKSAAQGFARAEYLLCLKSAEPHSLENERCLRHAAEGGVPEAQLWLAVSFDDNWFGITDKQEALKWLKRSAEGDNADAEASLGYRYEFGDGVEQDYVKAAYWFRRAAEHVPNLGGAGQGRSQLALLCLQGYGVPRDYVQAGMWFILAGFDANSHIDHHRMTAEEISQAQRLAADWKKQHPDPAIY